MAEFPALVQQYRNQLVVKLFKLGVGIDIKHLDFNPEFQRQWRQRHLHIAAEMAIIARNQGQHGQLLTLFVRHALDGDESLHFATPHEQRDIGGFIELQQ